MIYQPAKIKELWDTWLFYYEGVHYLYYLHKSSSTTKWDGRSVVTSLETSSPWDGISVAISKDGIHFDEVGSVISMKEDAEWLGTGSVWRADDRFIMNFSECTNGVQAIFFAESEDLIHWNRLGDEFKCTSDPRWYDDSPTGRWDCIWAHQLDDSSYIGYLTARPWSTTPGISYESVGKVVSEDGVHWKAVPPPEFEWGDWPRMNVGEVGALEHIHDRYYLLVGGYMEDQLGNRQIDGYLPNAKGMYTFCSDSPHGPFKPDKENYRLLVSRSYMTYFTRFYKIPDGILVNHHSIEHCGDTPLMWLAPLKEAVLDGEGHLSLGYWEKNEGMKGKELELDLTEGEKVFPKEVSGDWVFTRNSASISAPNSGGLVMLNNSFDIQRGIIFEGSFKIGVSEKRWGGIGLYIELNEDEYSGTD